MLHKVLKENTTLTEAELEGGEGGFCLEPAPPGSPEVLSVPSPPGKEKESFDISRVEHSSSEIHIKTSDLQNVILELQNEIMIFQLGESKVKNLVEIQC